MASFLTAVGCRKLGLTAVVLHLWLAVSCGNLTARPQVVEAIKQGKEAGHYIPAVPFVGQKDKQCGPAALASVLGYYGDLTDEGWIAKEAYSPILKGSLISDLEDCARRRGFYARVGTGSLSDLKVHIQRNEPVIILIDQGFAAYQKPHYLVVVGYSEERKLVIAHSGTEANALWPCELLESAWAKMNHLYLLVLPPSKAIRG